MKELLRRIAWARARRWNCGSRPAFPPVMADENQLSLAMLNLVGQCARRHAGRRHGARSRPRKQIAGRRQSTWACPRALCAPVGERQRQGHGCRDLGARHRAVLHHQGRGQGHRPGPFRWCRAWPSNWAGKFVLTSRKGEGTRAEMWLRAAAARCAPTRSRRIVTPSRHRAGAAHPGGGRRSSGAVQHRRDAARARPYRVEAASGQAALDLMSGQAVDLVITDQVMPKMTGRAIDRTSAQAESRAAGDPGHRLCRSAPGFRRRHPAPEKALHPGRIAQRHREHRGRWCELAHLDPVPVRLLRACEACRRGRGPKAGGGN